MMKRHVYSVAAAKIIVGWASLLFNHGILFAGSTDQQYRYAGHPRGLTAKGEEFGEEEAKGRSVDIKAARLKS